METLKEALATIGFVLALIVGFCLMGLGFYAVGLDPELAVVVLGAVLLFAFCGMVGK